MAGQYHNMFDLLQTPEEAPRKKKSKAQPKKEAAPASNANNDNSHKKGKRRRRRGGGGGEGTRRQGPKREFDRQSGTGRGKEVNKKGHGKGGWGREDEFASEPEANMNPPRQQEAPAPVVAKAEPVEEEEAAPVVPVRPKTPEPVRISLDEHLAARAATKRADVFEHEQVVMGAQWGKVSNLHDSDEDYEKVERKVQKKKGRKGKKGRKKATMSLQELSALHIEPQEQGGKFQARRNGRGNRRKQNQKAKKDTDFPALGSK